MILGAAMVVRLAAGPVSECWPILGASPYARILRYPGSRNGRRIVAGKDLLLAVLYCFGSGCGTCPDNVDCRRFVSQRSKAFRAGKPFGYGWIRGAASAAFVLGTIIIGQLISPDDLVPIVWMNAALLLAAACATALVPGASAQPGPRIAIVRWSIKGVTTSVMPLSIVQPLHGLTFALLHLACMRMMGALVPTNLSATAQSLYAFGSTLTTAALTLLSGTLYAKYGGASFFPMAILCGAALPFAWFGLAEKPLPRSPT